MKLSFPLVGLSLCSVPIRFVPAAVTGFDNFNEFLSEVNAPFGLASDDFAVLPGVEPGDITAYGHDKENFTIHDMTYDVLRGTQDSYWLGYTEGSDPAPVRGQPIDGGLLLMKHYDNEAIEIVPREPIYAWGMDFYASELISYYANEFVFEVELENDSTDVITVDIPGPTHGEEDTFVFAGFSSDTAVTKFIMYGYRSDSSLESFRGYWYVNMIRYAFTTDQCPEDPGKTLPGKCGCGKSDTDSDSDGTPDCVDVCPTDPLKTDDAGVCGCGAIDSDGDGTLDCVDECPLDPLKVDEPGMCGCGVQETDSNNDGVLDCLEVPVAVTVAGGEERCFQAIVAWDYSNVVDWFDTNPELGYGAYPATDGDGNNIVEGVDNMKRMGLSVVKTRAGPSVVAVYDSIDHTEGAQLWVLVSCHGACAGVNMATSNSVNIIAVVADDPEEDDVFHARRSSSSVVIKQYWPAHSTGGFATVPLAENDEVCLYIYGATEPMNGGVYFYEMFHDAYQKTKLADRMFDVKKEYICVKIGSSTCSSQV